MRSRLSGRATRLRSSHQALSVAGTFGCWGHHPKPPQGVRPSDRGNHDCVQDCSAVRVHRKMRHVRSPRIQRMDTGFHAPERPSSFRSADTRPAYPVFRYFENEIHVRHSKTHTLQRRQVSERKEIQPDIVTHLFRLATESSTNFEYYSATDDQYSRFLADTATTIHFAEPFRRHEHDDLLIQ